MKKQDSLDYCLTSGTLVPDARHHLGAIAKLLESKIPFTFIRFSDGETEIIRNRYLEISNGKTFFRGRIFSNDFPKLDSKRFDPRIHQEIRRDLLCAASFRSSLYFKGIPTKHNGSPLDKDLMLRLNGGFDENLTFTDLFLNSNYAHYLSCVVPLFNSFPNISILANYRACPDEFFKKPHVIPVGDNFFANYRNEKQAVMKALSTIEEGSLVLASASTLAKTIGFELHNLRPDITYIDVGTTINHLLGLPSSREYHLTSNHGLKAFIYKLSSRYKIKW